MQEDRDQKPTDGREPTDRWTKEARQEEFPMERLLLSAFCLSRSRCVIEDSTHPTIRPSALLDGKT